MASNAGLIRDQALGLRRLVNGADSIELKINLPEHSDCSAAAALGGGRPRRRPPSAPR